MEDKEIVSLYFDRNEQAIAETARKYGSYCTSIAMNILNDRQDAEECVNDTYMSTWNAIPPHKPSVLSTFLGKITRNLSFNKYKAKHSAKRGGYEIALILDELSEVVSDEDTVEDHIDQAELIKAVNAFLSELPENKRYMFVRRYWYSDSLKEIASRCGRTENSTAVELSRIRKALRVYLSERSFEL